MSYTSPPLWKIVETINKNSQNLYAELILRAIGAKVKHTGSSQESIDVLKKVVSDMGINPQEIQIVDGSGLSRLNLITPKQIVTLLRYMRRHPLSEYFYNSLPIAGKDGSLIRRMKETSAAGNVRAKTGYLGNSVALSGYLKTNDEEEFAFSILTNNFTVPTSMAHNIQDLVCEILTNFRR